MNSDRKYTIDEIASEAGVSKATVSRVMNGTAPVSELKKRQVEKTIKKMGYHPNQNARKLAGGVGGSIALVLEESTEEFFLNPFWKLVVQGFIGESSSNGLHPVLFFHSKDESDENLIQALIRGNYDAVAIFGWHRDIKKLERYVPDNMEVVFGGNQGKSTRFTYVGVDNEVGGEMATQHLIDQGCRDIVIITGDLEIQSARERLAGYEQALEKNGIKIRKNLILEGDFTQESAEKALTQAIQKRIPFDGIFAANDLMAAGCMKVLEGAKIKVPHQVKLIGFDGSDIALKSTPPITTIAQPSFDLGATVARNLAKVLKRETISSVKLDLELMTGATTQLE